MTGENVVSSDVLERLRRQDRGVLPTGAEPEPAPEAAADDARPAGPAFAALGELAPPPALPDEGSRAVWREVVTELARVGWVRRVDTPALVGMCQAVALRDFLYSRLFDRKGNPMRMITYETRGRNGAQRKRAPLFQAYREVSLDAQRACAEIGITPKARHVMTGGGQAGLFEALDGADADSA
ncbi:MAG: P27 family phage terminase small subunit [Pseudomonadota bacterium]